MHSFRRSFVLIGAASAVAAIATAGLHRARAQEPAPVPPVEAPPAAPRVEAPSPPPDEAPPAPPVVPQPATPVQTPHVPEAAMPPVAPPPPPSAAVRPPPPPQASSAAEPVQHSFARIDYSDGSFYWRSFDDNMVIMPSGRMHIDTYVYAGDGVGDYRRANNTALKTQIFFRRFVIESGGLIYKRWFWWMGGNFSPALLDANQALVSNAHVYDGFIGFMPTPDIRLYFGQFNAPVTMENVTSSRWLDFMERALLVRTIAVPENKAIGAMFWGDTHDKFYEWQLGGLSIDGVQNRPVVDGHFNLMARFLVRPLARSADGALKRFHIGGSGRYGNRNPNVVNFDAPPMTTPGGYAYWSSMYGMDDEQTVVIPANRQAVVAAEGYLPFERWDLRGEFVWTHQERREALVAHRNDSLRGGLLDGYGAYGQASFWLAGTPRITGNPGNFYGIYKLPDEFGKPQAPYGIQLVLRGEVIRLNYDSNSRFGTPGGLDVNTDHIRVNAYQACVNAWVTKHIRLTAEYSLYQFPGTPFTSNQAVAPGVRAGTALDAHVLNEISFRAGLAL